MHAVPELSIVLISAFLNSTPTSKFLKLLRPHDLLQDAGRTEGEHPQRACGQQDSH
ncbi:MAG: hypothetical protein HC902_04645 [Calothrix sp. SM1_5_4]|nr:hypothetical protein [Calothrix sp. SM1_5_4]